MVSLLLRRVVINHLFTKLELSQRVTWSFYLIGYPSRASNQANSSLEWTRKFIHPASPMQLSLSKNVCLFYSVFRRLGAKRRRRLRAKFYSKQTSFHSLKLLYKAAERWHFFLRLNVHQTCIMFAAATGQYRSGAEQKKHCDIHHAHCCVFTNPLWHKLLTRTTRYYHPSKTSSVNDKSLNCVVETEYTSWDLNQLASHDSEYSTVLDKMWWRGQIKWDGRNRWRGVSPRNSSHWNALNYIRNDLSN